MWGRVGIIELGFCVAGFVFLPVSKISRFRDLNNVRWEKFGEMYGQNGPQCQFFSYPFTLDVGKGFYLGLVWEPYICCIKNRKS